MPRTTDRAREEGDDSSFARGLRVLRAVAERPGARAETLAAALEMPVSTVYRYLRTLADEGLVERRGGAFHLDPGVLAGGGGANVTSALLVAAAGPVLASLAERAAETALLARRIGTAAICLDAVEPSRALRVALPAGELLPLATGAVGRILLAWAPPEVLAETPGVGGRGRSALAATLASVRVAGVAVDESDGPDAIVTVAAPILRTDGIAGALGLRGPASRCDAAWRERAGTLLREGADAIVEALGAPVAQEEAPTRTTSQRSAL